MKDAPWIGLCREESFGKYDSELIGYCECCGEPVYQNDDYVNFDGIILCDTCHNYYIYEEDIDDA